MSSAASAEQRLRFALAGTVQGWIGDAPLELGPPQRRALLALLILGAGRVLSVDELVDGIWGETPPTRPLAALQAHVSMLRRVLEPARRRRSTDGVLRSVGRGYSLNVVGVEIDVFLFRHQLRLARAARENGDVDRCRVLLRGALQQWAGVGLVGLPGPGVEMHRRALYEERLGVFEDYVQLELDNDVSAVPEGEIISLIRDSPHRESLYGLRMMLLHRRGRRGEALSVYSGLRSRLVEDLGIDPGIELKRLHQAILSDEADPATPAAHRTAAAPVLQVATHQECHDFGAVPSIGAAMRAADLVGRAEQLRLLDRALRPGAERVVILHGLPGVGTTSLAMTAAAQAAGRFPGGVSVVTVDDVVESVPAAGSLLVLDGVRSEADLERRIGAERGAAGARAQSFVEGGACVMIVGTYLVRRLLRAYRVEVPALDAEQAHALFVRDLDAERVAASPEAVKELVGRTGGLPVVITANVEMLAKHPRWSIADYYRTIRAQEAADPAWLSVEGLGLFFGRAIAVLDLDTLAFLSEIARLRPAFPRREIQLRTKGNERRVNVLLDRLVDHSLLAQPLPDYYCLNPAVREFALSLAAYSQPGRSAHHDQQLAVPVAGGPGTAFELEHAGRAVC